MRRWLKIDNLHCVTRATSLIILLGLMLASQAVSDEPKAGDKSTTQSIDRSITLVPQQLLGLLHAPQTHKELGLTAENVKKLETLFAQTDGPWWRSRILRREQQYSEIKQQEEILRKQLKSFMTAKQMERLDELELQSQAARMLLRPTVATAVGLSADQTAKLVALFDKTEQIATEVEDATRKNKVDPQLTQKLKEARAGEDSAALKILSPDQQVKLSQKMGKPFDMKLLQRIYPTAPPLEGIESWVNTDGVNLAELKGKVVAVHFYAFGCSNCKANLPIYNKLHDEFAASNFAMVGIHTPETPEERDMAKVKSVAVKDGIKYPVAIDQQSSTWKAWGNTMWPTIYIVDKNGYIRYWWQGELQWQGATGDETVRKMIRQLLEES